MSKYDSITEGRNRLRRNKNGHYTVYVIKLFSHAIDDEMYYVGRSKDVESRIYNHKLDSTTITQVTEEHGKVKTEYELRSVIEKIECSSIGESQFVERQMYVKLASEHGVSKVAGGL